MISPPKPSYLDRDCLNAVSSLDVFLWGPLEDPLCPLWMFSLDLGMAVRRMSQSRSLDLERLFLRLELRETFSKMASRDLDRYRLRSVALFRHVWHDLKGEMVRNVSCEVRLQILESCNGTVL